MSNFEEVGKAFVQHYYTKFDANQRQELIALYQDQSMLTWELEKFQGKDNIVKKLTSLTFQHVKHGISTLDCQPTVGNGILVFVNGQLVIDNENDKPVRFSEVFNLLPIPNTGGFFVFNHIFRFNMM